MRGKTGTLLKRLAVRLLAAVCIVAPTVAFAAPPVSDDFNWCALRQNVWTVVDPVGDCDVSLVNVGTTNAQLQFTIPAGVEHDAWVNGNFMPRVVQSVDNTDFTVEIKIESPMTQPFQGIGIMVLESPGRFIRFEVHRAQASQKIFVASIVDANATVHDYPDFAQATPIWLRLQRVGNTWTPSWSGNGTTFTNLNSFNTTLNVTQVGVHALNAANGGNPAPAFTGLVDYFFNTASPIVNEDQGGIGNPTNNLTVSVVGDGIVQSNPPGPTYACGETVTLTAVPGPGSGFAGWSGDLTGQTNPAQYTVVVESNITATFQLDNVAPMITCPNDIIAEVGNIPPPDFAGVIATDNFDPSPEITFEDVGLAAGVCPEVSSIQRTWTATDEALNTASCVQVIHIHDTTAPVITGVPANITVECDQIPAPPGNVMATDAGDPAPMLVFSETTVPGNCDGRFTLTRKWTATDTCGNTSVATQKITVRDTTPPTITLAPVPQLVQCSAIPPVQTPTIIDNCDPAPQVVFNETTSAGTCATGYTITRTWSATDVCGNVRYASVSFNVVDTLAPVLTVPGNISISCSESIAPSNTGTATAIDAADPAPIVSFVDTVIPGSCPNSAAISRKWTATDWAGNASTGTQLITIADTLPPVITGVPPGEVMASCDSIPAPPVPVITDDCDPAPQVTYTEVRNSPVGDCKNGFTILRTWTATDSCGNQSQATQTIRMVDTTAPVITIPPDITISCGDTSRGGGMTFSPTAPGNSGTATATDNCSDVSEVVITYSDVFLPNTGLPTDGIVARIKRKWTATDGCGNTATGIQGITIIDHTPPGVVQCPPARMLSTRDLLAQATGVDTAPKRAAPIPDFRNELVAIDTCADEVFIKQNPPAGTMLNLGTHVISFDVTDSFGNTQIDACRFLLTLVPMLPTNEDLCPDDPNKTEPGLCGCGVPDTDTDNDGVPDCIDQCPNDPNKVTPGSCGCGNPDIDSDNDGTPDCDDECPNDPNKTLLGACGCGNPDTDSDGDGAPDCDDGCPNDPNKVAPGSCGCGNPDIDSDNDGTPDCIDLCPDDPNKIDPGSCGCGNVDEDLNLNQIPDCAETCPAPGDCFIPHENAGCAFPECCDAVCTTDPYCCNVEWDVVCASQALAVCSAPPGNECDDALVVTDGSYIATLVDNSGVSGDDTNGPVCAAVADTIDEWFAYTAQYAGTATVTTCSPETTINTTLAIYTECGGNAMICATADANCDFGSTVTWDLDFGQTYLIRVSAVDDVVGPYELTIDSEPAIVPPEVLSIDFWYGPNQNFGAIGQPQRQVNLLGNVTSMHGVQTLQYELNGGPPLPLSIGPDTRRLYGVGDFNVELFYAELPAGPNQCLVRAIDNLGNVVTKTLNFNVTQTNVWPLPYSINWNTAPDIQSVAQVVDGKWQIEPDGVHIIEQGYDRLIALGDISWTNYEITVPITIHAIDPNGYLPPSHTPGLGLIIRWEGHTDFLEPGSQPSIGYWPLGAAAEYVFHLDQCGYRLQLYGNPFVLQDQDDTCQPVPFDVPYMWKVRVQTLGDGTHHYQFKVWPQGSGEPAGWNLEMIEPSYQPDNGCLMLFSHHVDATFGNVQVVPVP